MKKQIHLKYLILLFLFFVPLISCKKVQTGTLTQTAHGITGELSFDSDPIVVMKPVTLTLQITDSLGNPIESNQVSFDFTMPAMKMPPNQPQATSQGNGLYTVQTGFSMSGDWQAEVTILQDSKTTTLIFDFKVQ